jgi:hypothetical protein
MVEETAVHPIQIADLNDAEGRLRVIKCSEPSRLCNVDYVSKLDLASTNRGVSTVGPIGRVDALAAFEQHEVPHEVAAEADRDDVSSIGSVSHIHKPEDYKRDDRRLDGAQRLEARKLDRQRLELRKLGVQAQRLKAKRLKALTARGCADIEHGIRETEASDMTSMKQGSWYSSRRTELEMFFIGLISVSLLTLIILLTLMMKQR